MPNLPPRDPDALVEACADTDVRRWNLPSVPTLEAALARIGR